jgi:hypothetical protein
VSPGNSRQHRDPLCVLHRGSTRSAGTARPRWSPDQSGIPWTCGVGRRTFLLPATGQRYAVPSDRVKLRQGRCRARHPRRPGTIVTACGQRVARTKPPGLRSGGSEVPCRRRRPSGAPRGEQSGDHSDAALTCEDVRGTRSAPCLGPARSTPAGRGSQLVDKLVETLTPRPGTAATPASVTPDREG